MVKSIGAHLDASNYGIILVTRENQQKPWVMFEAGALSKLVTDDARVVPLLVDLSAGELLPPLGHFQARKLDGVDVRRIVEDLNALRESAKLSEAQLQATFEAFWPKLEAAVADVVARERAKAQGVPPAKRADHEVLEEVLTTVRGLARDVQDLSSKAREITTTTTGPRGLTLADMSQFGTPHIQHVSGGLLGGGGLLAPSTLNADDLRYLAQTLEKSDVERAGLLGGIKLTNFADLGVPPVTSTPTGKPVAAAPANPPAAKPKGPEKK